ncbi:MAG: tyrosine-type recombinase/integrase [Pirellulales bacterium]
MTDDEDQRRPRLELLAPAPAFAGTVGRRGASLKEALAKAVAAWLLRTPSAATRKNYRSDLNQFLTFASIHREHPEALLETRPEDVASWREYLQDKGLTNSTVARKLTVLRSLFSYLQIYGYTGANPAHSKFVATPPVPRDGKTVGLSPRGCRRLLDAPDPMTPVGIRDRAILSTLAYSACRVGELVKLTVQDLKTSGEHRVLALYGKGGKERTVPLHVEAIERLNAWIAAAKISDDRDGPLFRPPLTSRGKGREGFAPRTLSVRAIEYLVERYALLCGLDPAVTVHSLRVTALTTARERGADIVDLQDFAGHSDPRTTLTYVRTRDRLSKSPAYVLKY